MKLASDFELLQQTRVSTRFDLVSGSGLARRAEAALKSFKHGALAASSGRVLLAMFFVQLNCHSAEPAVAAGLDSVVSNARYKIAVCDWMILKRQKLGALQLAKDIGADGLELDMGGLGNRETFDSQLGNSEIRQQFLDKARDLNLEISSIAMSGFYAQSFAERPTVPRMIDDCIATMKAMNVKTAFLPLGVASDPARHPELRTALIERLKMAGAKAVEAGVVIGIETELAAEDQIRLLDDVGSPGIRLYYNFANAIQNKRDVAKELRALGKERICQIHCTNQDGVWLQDDPAVDMKEIKAALDDIGWSGWLVMERSRKANDSRNVRGNFGANAAYLKNVFQIEAGNAPSVH